MCWPWNMGVFEAAQSNESSTTTPKEVELGFFLLTEIQKISKFISSLEMEKSLPLGVFFRIYDMQKAA